jgi:ABC-2 type transport system ATP-binding protein
MVSQLVQCPRCKQQQTVEGNPGEKIVITCSHCGLKGTSTFPGRKPTGPVSIQVDGCTKIFKNLKAVDSVSFHVNTGEIFGFLGPNGAGKTTMIKAMLGLIHLTSGDIKINGYRINGESIFARKKIGYLPERVAFYENLTPLQTMHFFCELRGVDKSVARPLLKEVGLEDAIDRKVGTFSKGMIQLLGVAQALIGNPSVYILDEPTSGLDPRWAKIIRDKIKLVNAKGATVLFSSHNLHEVETLCDRVAVINKGRLIVEDSVASLSTYLHIRPRLEITISGLNGEVPKILSNVPGIEALDVKDDTLFVTCDPAVRSKIIASLEKAKYTIINMKTIEPSLEDMFIKLIEGGA